jgi:hypothetical protein
MQPGLFIKQLCTIHLAVMFDRQVPEEMEVKDCSREATGARRRLQKLLASVYLIIASTNVSAESLTVSQARLNEIGPESKSLLPGQHVSSAGTRFVSQTYFDFAAGELKTFSAQASAYADATTNFGLNSASLSSEAIAPRPPRNAFSLSISANSSASSFWRDQLQVHGVADHQDVVVRWSGSVSGTLYAPPDAFSPRDYYSGSVGLTFHYGFSTSTGALVVLQTGSLLDIVQLDGSFHIPWVLDDRVVPEHPFLADSVLEIRSTVERLSCLNPDCFRSLSLKAESSIEGLQIDPMFKLVSSSGALIQTGDGVYSYRVSAIPDLVPVLSNFLGLLLVAAIYRRHYARASHR